MTAMPATPRCFDCQYWAPHDDTEPFPQESLGLCLFPAVLPWSMRYSNRERVETYGDQGTECKCFKPKK